MSSKFIKYAAEYYKNKHKFGVRKLIFDKNIEKTIYWFTTVDVCNEHRLHLLNLILTYGLVYKNSKFLFRQNGRLVPKNKKVQIAKSRNFNTLHVYLSLV